MMNKKTFAVICCFAISQLSAMEQAVYFRSNTNENINNLNNASLVATPLSSAQQDLKTISNIQQPRQSHHMNLLDKDTVYRLEQGLPISEAHPINTLKKVSYLSHNHVVGDIIKKTYRNEYFGKQEEHAKKQNELLESKKLLHARFKKLAIIAIVVACIWQYQTKNNTLLMNEIFHFFYNRFNAHVAELVVTMCNIVALVGAQALLPYILGTVGTWWETQKKSAELKRFDLKKGHWELESSELAAVPFVDEQQLQAYAKSEDDRYKKISMLFSNMAAL